MGGPECHVLSARLRDALRFILTCHGEAGLETKLAILCDVGEDLLTAARDTMTRGTYGGYMGTGVTKGHTRRPALTPLPLPAVRTHTANQGNQVLELTAENLAQLNDSGDMEVSASKRKWGTNGVGAGSSLALGGPRNPEAVQLLRVLQVVADLREPLVESWLWARDWLAEVCDRKETYKWAKQGLHIDEVREVRAALRGPGGQKVEQETPTHGTEEAVLVVIGSGTPEANGEYVLLFEDDDGNSHYEMRSNHNYALFQDRNKWNEVQWSIEEVEEHTLLYRTFACGPEVDSQYPPSQASEWSVLYGLPPPPRVVLSTFEAHIVGSLLVTDGIR